MAGGFWKGAISFGLLNIPVSLQGMDRSEEIHFTMLDGKDLARIRFKRVNERTGKEVPYHQIVKGYEYEKSHFVIVTDADFKAANPKAAQAIEIQDFVDLDAIDPLLFERPYTVVPQKQGEKGYVLLRDAMAKEGKVAVAKVVLRAKQHLAALMARGEHLVLELMRFPHEVGEAEGASPKAGYSARELKMAEALLRDMSSGWDPRRYEDTYYRDLLKRIEAKVKAGKGEVIETEGRAHGKAPPVVGSADILDLLSRSLRKKGKRAA